MAPDFVATPDRRPGLFLLSGGGPGTFLYYVLERRPAVRDSISIEETWRGAADAEDPGDSPGWYVFVDERLDSIDLAWKLGNRVREQLPSVSRLANGLTRRGIAWIPGVREWLAEPGARTPRVLRLVQYSWQYPSSRAVLDPSFELDWSDGLSLRLPGGSTVECVTGDGARFEISATRLDLRNDTGTIPGVHPGVEGARLSVPLTPEYAGEVAFQIRRRSRAMATRSLRLPPLRPRAGVKM